ncbi:unnamed protein product, partial [Musa banksii]
MCSGKSISRGSYLAPHIPADQIPPVLADMMPIESWTGCGGANTSVNWSITASSSFFGFCI